MTVCLCRVCKKTFNVDLKKDAINPAILDLCPDCLHVEQHRRFDEGEQSTFAPEPEKKKEVWGQDWF